MKMLKILAAPLALAAATLSMTSAVQAQPVRFHHGPVQAGWNLIPVRSAQIRQDIAQLNAQIDRAVQRRAISPREAFGLRQQARGIQQLYRSYQRGGLTRGEVQTLQSRVNQVRVALRMERLDWDGHRG